MNSKNFGPLRKKSMDSTTFFHKYPNLQIQYGENRAVLQCPTGLAQCPAYRCHSVNAKLTSVTTFSNPYYLATSPSPRQGKQANRAGQVSISVTSVDLSLARTTLACPLLQSGPHLGKLDSNWWVKAGQFTSTLRAALLCTGEQAAATGTKVVARYSDPGWLSGV